MLTRFAVAVPAHNDQDLLQECLAALRVAAAGATAATEVIVVADNCSDATAALARNAGAEVVQVVAGNVGRAHATGGTDVLVGTVEVRDGTPWPAAVRDAYEIGYRMTPEHVHGANLGVAASAYAFAPLGHDEDRDLVTRAARAGLRVVQEAGCLVVTSARRAARAPAGFAAHLASVAGQVSAG